MAVVSGGTTLIDNGALDAAVPSGSLILLSTQTASASANISFTSGIDSTYDSYVFKGINVHPASDDNFLLFNFSTDSGSNYNVTKTTTHIRVRHDENDNDGSISYQSNQDLAQSTSDARFTFFGNDNDQSSSFTLQLFNPSSTTFVKHFIADGTGVEEADRCYQTLTAGYCNTTSAVNGIIFKMAAGNIDSGTIKMYGVK
jgi:hypothetical protein